MGWTMTERWEPGVAEIPLYSDNVKTALQRVSVRFYVVPCERFTFPKKDYIERWLPFLA